MWFGTTRPLSRVEKFRTFQAVGQIIYQEHLDNHYKHLTTYYPPLNQRLMLFMATFTPLFGK